MQQVLAIPEPGDVIGGKYRIERAVGAGGMGAVFEVSHVITNKRFALKWLLADVNSGVAITRFIREAKVAGRFQHRNIVEVYDIDREGNSFFMVMELLKGQSLAERLNREGRMVTREACRLLLPCMQAIGAAHAAGIIHRDIKPANIFLCAPRGDEPELPKVLDFGVASFASAQGEDFANTRSGALVGTPFYMAPEQMRGGPIDQRVDIYALGVTLYEVLSCERPFKADSYGDLVLKVASETPTALEVLVPDLPKGLSAIVKKAMAREPERRYANTDELIKALEPFRENSIAARIGFDTVIRPVQALEETPLFSETRSNPFVATPRSAWGRRMRLLIAGLGLALVAAWLAMRASNADQATPAHVASEQSNDNRAAFPREEPVSAPAPASEQAIPSEPSPPATTLPVQTTPAQKSAETRLRRTQPSAADTTPPRRSKRNKAPAEGDPDERLDNRPAVRERAPASVILQRGDF